MAHLDAQKMSTVVKHNVQLMEYASVPEQSKNEKKLFSYTQTILTRSRHPLTM